MLPYSMQGSSTPELLHFLDPCHAVINGPCVRKEFHGGKRVKLFKPVTTR